MNVVFITVDPERDTNEAMAGMSAISILRSAGGPVRKKEIARATRGFRARYERVPTDGGDYTMNHTASVFLFDAAGQFTTMIDYHEPRECAVPKIRRALNEENRGQHERSRIITAGVGVAVALSAGGLAISEHLVEGDGPSRSRPPLPRGRHPSSRLHASRIETETPQFAQPHYGPRKTTPAHATAG